MLDFLNDLNLCPDSSFEQDKDRDNLMEDFNEPEILKPFELPQNFDLY